MNDEILELNKIIVTRQQEDAPTPLPPPSLEYGEIATDVQGNLYVGDKNKKVQATMKKENYDPNNNGINITLQQYTHSKDGVLHSLTGQGNNIYFLATDSFHQDDIFEINGVPVTAQTISGEPLWDGYFTNGAVVTCYRSGSIINFNSGGFSSAEAAKITPENLKDGITVKVKGEPITGIFTHDGDVISDDILEGKIAYSKGQKVVGTIPVARSNQILIAEALPLEGVIDIPQGYYPPGTLVSFVGSQFLESAGVTADKLAAGTFVMGIHGDFTSDGDATENDIAQGKVAYVNGQRIVGAGTKDDALSLDGGIFFQEWKDGSPVSFYDFDNSFLEAQNYNNSIYVKQSATYSLNFLVFSGDSVNRIDVSSYGNSLWQSDAIGSYTREKITTTLYLEAHTVITIKNVIETGRLTAIITPIIQ